MRRNDYDWLPLSSDYSEHDKTLHLCELLDNPTADAYPVRLMCWLRTQENATGTFRSDAAIETIARWTGERGVLCCALRTCGILDGLTYHNWATKGGARIVSMLSRRKHDVNSLQADCAQDVDSLVGKSKSKSKSNSKSEKENYAAPLPPSIPDNGGGGTAYALAEIRRIFRSPGDIAKAQKLADIERQGLSLRELVAHLKSPECAKADFYTAVEAWRKAKSPAPASARPKWETVTSHRKLEKWTPPPPETETANA